jgi:hypothetical protein
MARYSIKAPDGHIVTLEGPDGASESDVIAQAQRLYKPAPALDSRNLLQRTITDPFMRGVNQLQQSGNIGSALYGDDPSGAMQDFIRNERDKAQYPIDPAVAAGTQEIVDAQGIGGTAKALYKNPRAIFNTIVESLASSAPSLAGAAAGSIAGTIGGGAVGSAVPVIGTGIGGVAGGIAGGMAGAGAGSYATEFAGSVSDQLAQSGVDMQNPEAMAQMLANPDFRKNVLEKAGNRAEAVALFDALSMGVAGRIAGPVAKLVERPVGKALAGGSAEIAAQAGLGGSGEAAAQLRTEGRITSPGSIALEGLGEIIPGIGEGLINTAGDRVRDYKPQAKPPGGSPPPYFNHETFTPGQRGRFFYGDNIYEGTYRGADAQNGGVPIFRVQNEEFPDGVDLRVQPSNIQTMHEEQQQPVGSAYERLQRQSAQFQNQAPDRRSAAEIRQQRRIERQNQEILDLKRQQDAEFLANEQLASKAAETRLADVVETPRLTYDSTLAVTPQGVAMPRTKVIEQAAQEKQAKRDAAQKRIDDGYDPSVEAPAQVIDRAPLPPEPLPKEPAVAKPSPDFEAGPLVKNKHTDYTKPSEQTRKWIQGTVAELNDTSGGQRVFLEADRQGSTANVVGGKGNTPSWFSSYNNAAVDAQKNRQKVNKKNMTLEDSKKAALESVPQILTRQKVTEVANKILEGKPLGKAEVKVAEVIYGEAKAAREQNARQIVSQREGRAMTQQEELGDAAEPNLPPRDTSLDDIPFDIPVTKKPDSTQRFKSDAAFNQRAAERGVVTSKVIEDAGYHDPLTGSSFFPEDSTIDPRALDSKVDTKKNNKWQKEKIEVTTEDGTKAKVAAGDMTNALKSRAEILQKLKACLG